MNIHHRQFKNVLSIHLKMKAFLLQSGTMAVRAGLELPESIHIITCRISPFLLLFLKEFYDPVKSNLIMLHIPFIVFNRYSEQLRRAIQNKIDIFIPQFFERGG
ncbi:hypothetical protein D9M68_745310 [compost metagenome]